MKHKTLVIFGIVALLMVTFVGTALAQGTTDQLRTRDRLQTCTPEAQRDQLRTQDHLTTYAALAGDQLQTRDRLMICTPDGICTPQSGDRLQTRTQDRLVTSASQSGDQLQTRTQQRIKTSASGAQRAQARTRAK